MKKILLIEDDPVLRENTAELLELSHYRVLTAANGVLGVQSAQHQHPDLIICDIMMPELDGYGVLEALSKNVDTKTIPFIFLSAKTERQDVRKGMNLGADDYITKPFSEAELLSAIESRLAKMEILREMKDKVAIPQLEPKEAKSIIHNIEHCFELYGQSEQYDQDEVIYEEGNNSNHIFWIMKGLVKCHRLDEQGKELTTALHNAHDIFGYTSLSQNVPYQETATAIREVDVLSISKEEFKKIIDQNPSIAMEMVQLLADDLQGARDQLLQMAYGSVKKKTAQTILVFAEKLSPKKGEPIRISRTDLASVAGIATETLIRALSDFKKEGLIEIDGRNIKIVDLEGLEDMY